MKTKIIESFCSDCLAHYPADYHHECDGLMKMIVSAKKKGHTVVNVTSTKKPSELFEGPKSSLMKAFYEIATSKPSISLCSGCNCVTKTIKGVCGKCKAKK